MSKVVQIGRTVTVTPEIRNAIHAAAKAAGGWKPLARAIGMAPGHLYEIGHGKQKSVTSALWTRIGVPLYEWAARDVPGKTRIASGFNSRKRTLGTPDDPFNPFMDIFIQIFLSGGRTLQKVYVQSVMKARELGVQSPSESQAFKRFALWKRENKSPIAAKAPEPPAVGETDCDTDEADGQGTFGFFKALSDLSTHPDLGKGFFRNVTSVTITFERRGSRC